MTIRRALIALVVIGLLGVLANGVAEIYNFNRLESQNQAIQRQRYDISYATCKEQNERHDHTLAIFNADVAKLPKAKRARAQGTRLLLDAAVPYRDCLKIAKLTLGTPGPPLPPPPKPAPVTGSP